MKTTNYFFIALLIAFSTLFTACDDDGDTTKPTIRVITPSNNAVLTIGETFTFEATLTDNENLGSYKIDIHSADGHTHGETRAILTRDHEHNHGHDGDSNRFSYDNSWNLSGKEQTVKQDIEIPAGVDAGEYHLVVYCFDAAGNETYVARTLTLSE